MKNFIKSLLVLLISALAIQSFQCSTKEMVDAETAYTRKDYDLAIASLEKELAVNDSNNNKALLMYIEIKIEQGKTQEAAKSLLDAEKRVTEPKHRDKIPFLKNNLWIEAYNNGLRQRVEFLNTGDQKYLDSAIYNFETGIVLRKEIANFYFFKAISLELKGTKEDTLKALESYKGYIDVVKEEAEFAQKNEIYYDMIVDDALAKVKASPKGKIDTLSDKSIQRIDNFKVGEDYVYFYSKKNPEDENFKLKGWVLNYPSDWLPSEKLNFFEFELNNYFTLFNYYFFNNQKRESLIYLKEFVKINPFDEQVNSSIVQVYKDLGEEDKAEAELKSLTEKFPDNPLYWQTYGNFKANMNEYKEAIEIYKQALKADPKFALAFRNIASTFKNYAKEIQKDEEKKQDEAKENGETYDVNTDRYFPMLKSSVEYFEKAVSTPDFANEPMLMAEITDIYQILGEKEKYNSAVRNLENVFNNVKEENKEEFYLKLITIYSNANDQQRLNKVTRAYNKFRGK